MPKTDLKQALAVGDRIALTGGLDFEPKWLNGRSEYIGTLEQYIPGQNDTPAALIKLDEPITVQDVTGNLLVLELRHAGDQWKTTNTVHIELCDFQPEAKRWQDRRQGLWVESHATCLKLHP